MKTQQIMIKLVSILFLISACNPSREQMAATMAVQTIEARATGTAAVEQAVSEALTKAAPTITVTASPTEIVLPTATNTLIPPTPTVNPPAVLDNYLKNVRVVRVRKYSNMDSSVLSFSSDETESYSNLVKNRGFRAGEGILVDFKFTRGTQGDITLQTGQWDTNNYQTFGVHFRGTESKFLYWIGKIEYTVPLGKKIMLTDDNWYSVFLGIGHDGELLMLLWDLFDQNKVLSYRRDEMKESNWSTDIMVKNGTLSFDNLLELEFDDVLE